MSQKATFQLDSFIFNDIKIYFEDDTPPKEIKVDFIPSGVFNKKSHSYELTLTFIAFQGDNIENPFIRIKCIGVFTFDNVKEIEEIPTFFYRNAIAILFPYVRAFVSSITAQANIMPMILPTYNLGELEAPLRDNTLIK